MFTRKKLPTMDSVVDTRNVVWDGGNRPNTVIRIGLFVAAVCSNPEIAALYTRSRNPENSGQTRRVGNPEMGNRSRVYRLGI